MTEHYQDSDAYNHWSFHSVGQVGTWVLRWNGITEYFQEECYNVPVGVGRSTASAHTRLVERSVSMS